MPRPQALVGDVIAALAEAGFFSLRGVLIGTVAFQAYSALLGLRLPNTTMQTGDADFAQFHSISTAIGDTLPPILEVLRKVDPSFREIPHLSDMRASTQYVTRSGYRVEFLTPNTGSDDYAGQPTQMPALGGASADPLRFLDFLIHQPVRAIILHGAGVPVLVPSPKRYAVHKLILRSRRRKNDDGTSEARKDRLQAQTLIEALIAQRQSDAIADAYMEAWDRGPSWRDAIVESLETFEPDKSIKIRQSLSKAILKLGEAPAHYGLKNPV